MTHSEPSNAASARVDPVEADREMLLAGIVSELTDEIASGKSLELDDVCRRYPGFTEELRELWGVLMVTEVAGTERSSGYGAEDSQGRSAFDLPYEMAGYRLEQEIGRGGMGVVYRAVRLRDGTNVAVKVMLRGEFATEIDRMRFQAEAQAAARLEHPNIVPIFDVGQQSGNFFFSMKLIAGQTLANRLMQGPMSSEKAACLMAKVCDAVEHANKRGIFHRDLKPSNILLDDYDEPYLCDFGLAKQVRGEISLTRTGAVIGTPSYMAPEQAAGTRGQINEATEVYSLGAILYHTLTGRPPFMGDTPVNTVLMVLEQDPLPPRALNNKCDRRLEMITLRCLQKPQDLRYANAGQLARDLRAYLNNESVSAQEGRFGQVVASVFRETHNAAILENWGALWMWHSLVVFVACLATNVMYWMGVTTRIYYELMWSVGFILWALVFWQLRRRQGPVTFLERQIAHLWASSVIGVAFLFPLEGYLGLPLLRLAPILGVIASMVFVAKAGMLSGSFYIQAAGLMITAMVMAALPDYALILFGFACALSFFIPGLKYRRQRIKNKTAPQLPPTVRFPRELVR